MLLIHTGTDISLNQMLPRQIVTGRTISWQAAQAVIPMPATETPTGIGPEPQHFRGTFKLLNHGMPCDFDDKRT